MDLSPKTNRDRFPVLDKESRIFSDPQYTKVVRDQFVFLEFETSSCFDFQVLSDSTVTWIRFNDIKVKSGTYTRLAKKFGISLDTVRKIIRKQLWLQKKRMQNER